MKQARDKTTYHQIPDHHDQHEDQDAHGLARHFHTIPHGLDPLAAQHPEHDEEGVKEVLHVPARQRTILGDLAHAHLVILAEELHADHGEDEDDDGQHQGQVTQGAHRVTDDLDQHVQGWPRLSQLKNSQLGGRERDVEKLEERE